MDKSDSQKLAGVILAAGEGRRFGGAKALARINGVSFLELVAERLKRIGCSPIIAVAGSEAGAVEYECRLLEIGCVNNQNWRSGQFSSLQTGLKQIGDADGVLIALVDHPAVKLETYQGLSRAFVNNPNKILIPIYKDRKGHPIIIPGRLISDIIGASDNTTLKDILVIHEEIIFLFNCDDPGILFDIDRREDIEKAGL